jgi:hypothetical protein
MNALSHLLCPRSTGASKAIIFNHIVRNAPQRTDNYAISYKGPAAWPHVDVTLRFAPKLVKAIVPQMRSEAEYESISARDWQVAIL